MTGLRLITLPIHAALEMLVGLVAMAAPFVLGFSPAGAILGVVVGALFVGLALAATAPEGAGRRQLSIASHYAFDYGLATGLFAAAGVLAIAGDRAAGLFYALLALVQLTLNLSTRYTLRA